MAVFCAVRRFVRRNIDPRHPPLRPRGRVRYCTSDIQPLSIDIPPLPCYTFRFRNGRILGIMADRYEAAEFADDPLARAARALRYMEKMAVYASCGELGRSTLLRLQVGSATVLGYGLPDLVLRRDSDGVWFVHDEGLGDRHADRHAPKVIATPAGSQTRAERQAEAKRRYKEKRRAELAEKERARRARDRGDG